LNGVEPQNTEQGTPNTEVNARVHNLPPTIWENRRECHETFFEQREAYTSTFCGSVFDILRFTRMVAEGYSGNWVVLGEVGAGMNMPA
jgi:hypothetical protein